MRHRIGGYKLGRDGEHRRALRRNLAIALFTHGQITTTIPRAKSVQPMVERLITAAKAGTLADRRRVLQQLGDPLIIKGDKDRDIKRNKYGEVTGGPKLVKHLFDEIAPRYADRQGGYTRIVRLGAHRKGDGGDLCVLQLVGGEEGPNVKGRFSRRREKANKRMDFAANVRRGKSAAADASPAAGQPAASSPPAAEQPAAE